MPMSISANKQPQKRDDRPLLAVANCNEIFLKMIGREGHRRSQAMVIFIGASFQSSFPFNGHVSDYITYKF